MAAFRELFLEALTSLLVIYLLVICLFLISRVVYDLSVRRGLFQRQYPSYRISSQHFHWFMYRSNRSFNIPPPPPAHLTFWKLLFKFPATRAKMPFKCPSRRSIQVIKCSHPGDISQAHKWRKDGRNVFQWSSVVEQNLYKYSKRSAFNITKTEKHC